MITCIIPTFNREHLIGDAIDSVLSQDPQAMEIIVVDDGSTDGTLELLKRYGDRVTVMHAPGLTPGGARNVALPVAKGQYIHFLDSDDVALPGAYAALVALLETDPDLDYVWGRSETILMEGGAPQNPDWPMEPTFLQLMGSMLIRAESLRKLGGYNPVLRFGEDIDLSLRGVEAGWRDARTEQTILQYRRHTGNMTREKGGPIKGMFDAARLSIMRRRERT